MNVFIDAIQQNRIESEEDLKRLFWRLAKKLHPDVNSLESNHEQFINLKNEYDAAEEYLHKYGIKKHEKTIPNRELCIQLFVDLMASNFPVDKRIRSLKPYITRIEKLNTELSGFGSKYKNVFIEFENEMYNLKGENFTNHDYSLVRLYLYSFSDYTHLKYVTSENHIKNGYSIIHEVLEKHNMYKSIVFINWLVKDIV